MTRLTLLGIGGSGASAFAAQSPAAAPLAARYPWVDGERETRVVQDIVDLLHESSPSAETLRKAKRWIQQVLWDAEERRRWWFLEATAARWLNVGDDVVDVQGHINLVAAVWAPKRLKHMPISTLLELRQNRLANGGLNSGEPQHYALEAGRRIHLWPAPAKRYPFCVLYTRPMHIALVPNNWEGIILDGVLGKYGRHFDRDALTQDPADFEARYERRLQRASVATGHHDVEIIARWMAELATQAGTSIAAAGGSTTLLVPQSVRGVDYDTVEDAFYPLEVA